MAESQHFPLKTPQAWTLARRLEEQQPLITACWPDHSSIRPMFRRARGACLFDVDGNRFFDFDLDQGRLPFGHHPTFLSTLIKNHISLGQRHNLPQLELYRFSRALQQRLPGSEAYCFFLVPEGFQPDAASGAPAREQWLVPERIWQGEDNEPLVAAAREIRDKGAALWLDERGSAFCQRDSCFFPELDGDGALLRGCLGLSLLLVRRENPYRPELYVPPAWQVAAATEILRSLSGPRSPYPVIRRLVAQLERQAEGCFSGRAGIFPKLNIDDALRCRALENGILLAADGVVRVSAAHQPGQLRRLAAFLKREIRSGGEG